MGAVVGGWGTMIVLFSLASTIGIAVPSATWRSACSAPSAARPRQARRMVRAETLVVAVVAALSGAVAAAVGGRALFGHASRRRPGRRLGEFGGGAAPGAPPCSWC